jgi:indole-3-glycerol phosphate synthase
VTRSSLCLDRIVAQRRSDIGALYGSLSAADLARLACCGRPVRDFSTALTRRTDVAVIAEVKRASPSAGAIAPEVAAAVQAARYVAGGAAAVSVLTEPAFFSGSYEDLSDVAGSVAAPVLAKDFVVDRAQLFVARGHGADAVLLIVGVLQELLGTYLDLAATLGLQALVEVHDLPELMAARRAGATLVGVNSRDLKTLHVDRQAALSLVAEAVMPGVTVVAESGVTLPAHVVEAASAGADAVLVGEALMRAPRPQELIAALASAARRAGGKTVRETSLLRGQRAEGGE